MIGLVARLARGLDCRHGFTVGLTEEEALGVALGTALGASLGVTEGTTLGWQLGPPTVKPLG